MSESHATNGRVRPACGSAAVVMVAAACAIAWLALFRPGFMSADSAGQLMQARRGAFTDWHAPMMAGLWMLAERVVAGPLGMLVVQTAAFWTGLALLATRIAARTWARIAFLLVIGTAPPVVSIAGAIWKDVLMTSFLVLACGLAGRGVAFWPVILLATMSRHNAIAAVPAIVLLHLSSSGAPSLRALGRAGLASAALFLVALSITLLLVDRRTYPMQVFALGDLIGIAAVTQRLPTVDPCHVQDVAGDRREETPPDEPKLRAAVFAARTRFKYCADAEATNTLLGEWLRMVAEHPAAYVRYRRKTVGWLLGFDETPGNFVMSRSTYVPSDAKGIEAPAPATTWQDRFGTWMFGLEPYGVFRPWIYAVVGIAACATAAWRRRWTPCLVALSGLTCELVLFFVAPSRDYRYSHWMIVSALIAAAWVLAEGGAPRSRVSAAGRR